MQRTEWPFPTPWAAFTEISCLQQYAVVQFIWLPERYYQTGGAALENAVLHEMENGERKQNTYQRFLPGTCCKSPQQNYIDTHCLKILILFIAFFFFRSIDFFPPEKLFEYHLSLTEFYGRFTAAVSGKCSFACHFPCLSVTTECLSEQGSSAYSTVNSLNHFCSFTSLIYYITQGKILNWCTTCIKEWGRRNHSSLSRSSTHLFICSICFS